MLTANWEYSTLPETGKYLNHLLFGISAPPDPMQEQRKPIVLNLILDKSWSMKGEKMTALIDAASRFVSWMTRIDYLGIVAYAEDIQIIQPIVQLSDKQVVIDRLKNLKVGTSTNLSGGWLQGLRMAKEANVENAVRRVILLTDGLATMGIQDDDKLVQIAKDWQAQSVTTTTIGFGNDFNEETLKRISDAGGGNFYYIDSPEKTSEVFYQEFENVGSLFSQATELRIDFPQHIKFLEVLGDVPHFISDDNKIAIQLGDLRADESRKIVTVLEVEKPKEIEETSAVQVQLVYNSVSENLAPKEENINISIEFGNQDIVNIPKNGEVEIEVLVAWASKSLFDASKMAQTDVDAAIELLDNMKERLEEKQDLNAKLIESMQKRVDQMLKKLREDANIARKHLMVHGINLVSEHSREDYFQHIPMHQDIFEYACNTDLDLYNIPELKQKALKMIKRGYGYMIFDLTKVSFVDSSAIGGFIQISNWLQRRGGLMVVCCLNSTVMKIFELTHLDKYIEITSNVEEAKEIIKIKQGAKQE